MTTEVIPFSDKQRRFINNSNKKFNIAHGSVRSGKTVCSIFKFLADVAGSKPSDNIWILGHSMGTIKRNIVEAILDRHNPQTGAAAYCSQFFPGKNELYIAGKKIDCIGAKDEGSIGPIQGGTCDLMYCDEMTLYPDRVIQMLLSRLSRDGAKLIATMNPSHPGHPCKQLINRAEEGDEKYYSEHFSIYDNPYLTEDFVDSLRENFSGLFFRRYFLGEWCLAEGAIFDFFDLNVHTVKRPPTAAEFYLGGIDFGISNPFAAVIVGFNSGRSTQEGPQMWVEREYYWDPRVTHRQKTLDEFGKDMRDFFEDYGPRTVYIDPSATPLKVELRKYPHIHAVDAVNDVYAGICTMTTLIKKGTLTALKSCPNLIREMQQYSWDPTKTEQGKDAPIKREDHVVDALRYVCASFMKGKTSIVPLEVKAPDVAQDTRFGPGFGWQPLY